VPEAASSGRATPFADQRFEPALARANDEGRWLLVDVTDTSSPACWPMTQVWRDKEIAAWVGDHALAIQVDVATDDTTATTLQVAAPPAVILFREGKERARLEGTQEPSHLLRWLAWHEDLEVKLAEARAALIDPGRDAHGRHTLAQCLLHTRRFEESLDHFVWLWLHMDLGKPSMSGVRVSFLARNIATLCEELPAARERFCALRDESDAVARSATDSRAAAQARFDWIVLNQSLGDTGRTLSWFDGLNAGAQAGLSAAVIHRLPPLLIERERWADAGRLIRDPLEELGFHAAMLHLFLNDHDLLPEMNASHQNALRRSVLRAFREEVAQLLRCLREADREVEAAAVKRKALELDDSAEMRAALS
jgi:hypothetical protein